MKNIITAFISYNRTGLSDKSDLSCCALIPAIIEPHEIDTGWQITGIKYEGSFTR